jgi:multidrug efflux pump subunit AcrA (membrane-fusion protein)
MQAADAKLAPARAHSYTPQYRPVSIVSGAAGPSIDRCFNIILSASLIKGHPMTLISALHRISVSCLLASCGLFLPACDKKAQAGAGTKTNAPVNVTLAPARLESVQRSIDIVGTLFADEESVVSAKVPGRIIKLYKDIGDSVEPGEPLVQLKPNDYQLAVAKAKLELEQTLAKIGLKELPAPGYDVKSLLEKVPSVVKARLEAENAQAKLNRGKKLFEAQPPLLSEEKYADLETSLRVSRSELDVTVLASEATLAEAWTFKGDMDIATQRLADATTRAPSPANPKDLAPSAAPDGAPAASKRTYHVTHRYVNEGELVREITPCFRLVDDNRIKLRAKVPERFVAEIAIGQKVKTMVDAYPGVDFIGTVSRVNPQVDPENRTFGVEVIIPNSDHRLKPGSFARAAVETRTDAKIVFAPLESIITFAGVSKVFKVAGDKATEVVIETGIARSADGKHVEIASGLKGDEQLVVSGAGRLATGTSVIIKPASTTMPTTAPAR